MFHAPFVLWHCLAFYTVSFVSPVMFLFLFVLSHYSAIFWAFYLSPLMFHFQFELFDFLATFSALHLWPLVFHFQFELFDFLATFSALHLWLLVFHFEFVFFGSGLIYGSKKKKSTKCHFQTSFVLSYALCQYNVRLSATQKENANYPPTAWHKSCQRKYLLATTLVQSVSLSPEVDEHIQIIASVMFML